MTKKPMWFKILRDYVLTEKNTDKLIDILKKKIDIHGIPDEIVWTVIDRMVPETLLDALEELFVEEDQDESKVSDE